MPLLNFGQPLGSIIQVAYFVEDIQRSMKDFTARLKVGPWYVTQPFTPHEARYRGQPTQVNLTLAIGFAGHMSFELIQQHNDAPSVYLELAQKHGYGFHHWAVPVHEFEREIETYRALGYEAAFTDITPHGYRIAYMDTTRDLPGMIELVESTDSMEERYTKMYHASVGWDGADPIRPPVKTRIAARN